MPVKLEDSPMGTGEGPTKYLVRADYPGRDAHQPDVLRGLLLSLSILLGAGLGG